MKKCYFLIYRHSKLCYVIDWEQPTGGMVLEPDFVVEGHAGVCRMRIQDEAKDRYHCGPNEDLLIAEVFGEYECRAAQRLHQQWMADRIDFMTIMSASG